MTDTALNFYLAYGTNAQRLAFTPAPASPVSGPSPLYVWYETDTGNTYVYHGSWTTSAGTVTHTAGALTANSLIAGNGAADIKVATAAANSRWLGAGASGSGAAYTENTFGDGLGVNGTALQITSTITPQGRLTLTSGTPILTADATAQGTVYYTPYIGSVVPIYDGTRWAAKTFAEISLTLNATDNLSGSVYDVFVFNNSGTLTLGTGPAWSSTTSRGTGAGTTQISMLNGIWVNTVAITLRAGGASLGSQALNTCTYLGTAYMTANGQTGMAFQPAAAAGGTNNFLALYNAYNRIRSTAISRDSTASWTYASTTIRSANASTSNRISFIDGLQQSAIRSTYSVLAYGNGGVATPLLGQGLDSTTVFTGLSAEVVAATASNVNGGNTPNTIFIQPQLGFHFIQALEAAGTGTATYSGGNTTPTRQNQQLSVELEM